MPPRDRSTCNLRLPQATRVPRLGKPSEATWVDPTTSSLSSRSFLLTTCGRARLGPPAAVPNSPNARSLRSRRWTLPPPPARDSLAAGVADSRAAARSGHGCHHARRRRPKSHLSLRLPPHPEAIAGHSPPLAVVLQLLPSLPSSGQIRGGSNLPSRRPFAPCVARLGRELARQDRFP
jgi:hypothetical protein